MTREPLPNPPFCLCMSYSNSHTSNPRHGQQTIPPRYHAQKPKPCIQSKKCKGWHGMADPNSLYLFIVGLQRRENFHEQDCMGRITGPPGPPSLCRRLGQTPPQLLLLHLLLLLSTTLTSNSNKHHQQIANPSITPITWIRVQGSFLRGPFANCKYLPSLKAATVVSLLFLQCHTLMVNEV